MTTEKDYWTPERVQRLEHVLADQGDDIYMRAFLHRLLMETSFEKKQEMITRDMPLLLREHAFVRLWEGREVEGKLAARDALVSFLHQEGIIRNLPTETEEPSEEKATRDRLARLFGEGKPVSEIVIEERG